MILEQDFDAYGQRDNARLQVREKGIYTRTTLGPERNSVGTARRERTGAPIFTLGILERLEGPQQKAGKPSLGLWVHNRTRCPPLTKRTHLADSRGLRREWVRAGPVGLRARCWLQWESTPSLNIAHGCQGTTFPPIVESVSFYRSIQNLRHNASALRTRSFGNTNKVLLNFPKSSHSLIPLP